LTEAVLLGNLVLPMQHITTISHKGQIVVPKGIRDQLKIKPSDPLRVTLVNDNIIVKPFSSVNEFLGMFKVKKPITKKDIKTAISSKLSSKFK